MWPAVLLLLWIIGASARALEQVRPKHTDCVLACRRALVQFNFQEAGKPVRGCTGLYADSIFTCAATYCTYHEQNVGFAELNATYCVPNGKPMPPKPEDVPISNIPQVTYTEAKESINVSAVVVPDDYLFQVAYGSEYAFNRAMVFNWAFPMANIGFWGILLAIGVVHRHLSVDNLHPLSSSLKRTLSVPPVLQKTGVNGPTRLEALVLAIYFLMNFIFCFIGVNIMQVSLLDWYQVPVQYARYIANRCGYLALGNMPIIWLFSLRNNPFLWLTDWPFTTFNHFHRWVARFTVLLALVHGICYTIGESIQGLYHMDWSLLWFRCGPIALIILCLLTFFASRYFRQHFYDAFLLGHIAMACTFLVLLMYHLKFWKGQTRRDVWAFAWTCVALWTFDRVMRILRLGWFNSPSSTNRTKADVSYISKADVIRIDVTNSFMHKSKSAPRPGSYFYIYGSGGKRSYESHPFTLCSWTPEHSVEDFRKESTVNIADFTDEKDVVVAASESPSLDHNNNSTPRHTFLIRPFSGYTQRLRNRLSSLESGGGGGQLQLPILIEGPYGQPHPLDQHSDVVMLVAGIGITPVVSYLAWLLKKPKTHRIHLIWAVRSLHFAEEILNNELCVVKGRHGKLRCDVYLTGTTEDESSMRGEERSGFVVRSGRPDVHLILSRARREATRDVGVFCCASVGLVAVCREAVCVMLGETGKDVTLYEERFAW